MKNLLKGGREEAALCVSSVTQLAIWRDSSGQNVCTVRLVKGYTSRVCVGQGGKCIGRGFVNVGQN